MKDDTLDPQEQLKTALDECSQLRAENNRLKSLLNLQGEKEAPVSPPTSSSAGLITAVSNSSTNEEKLALFRSLFRGREDVYAIRWEGKEGKKGYSPAYTHDRNCPLCSDDWKKRSRCKKRKFLAVTDQTIRNHFFGNHTVGIYPLLTDETCWFLATDFDKKSWSEDAMAFLETCDSFQVPASLERSRSGDGGHVWIFFDSPIPASLARRMGCFLMTRTLEKRHQIGLDSYDRFFPNQDTLPKGGFGNLIALPLQKVPRDLGNSIFLSRSLSPYEDQWVHLSGIKKMAWGVVEQLVQEATRQGDIIGVPLYFEDEDDAKNRGAPWKNPPKKKEKRIQGPFPKKVNIILGNLVYVEKAGLPPAMLSRLLRLAAFQNPEFYKAQVMRLSTFGKPRIIACGDDFPKHIGLPRGCFEEVVELLSEYKIQVETQDERFPGNSTSVNFQGELRPAQKEAALALLKEDIGILSATTAFGKTVVAAWLIAARKINTLVLVHRRQLMDQWKERLALFLEIDKKDIGQIGGGKNKRTGKIDVGILQSLNRKGEVDGTVSEYGQVIVDECHHLSAFSFEQVLKSVKARYVVGLTATPTRKDGHHPIIQMQCGPIRFKVNAKEEAKNRPFEHHVIPRYTSFTVQQEFSGIQEVYGLLATDKNRNDLILDDLLNALEEGRSPLLLTERTEHLDELVQRLKGAAKNVMVLKGGMNQKERDAIRERIRNVPEGEERVLLATGRYIGEGFDDARLDTLFLAMPISWKGTLQQYVGRLHRLHTNKETVRVYDYVDVQVPMLRRMYERRLKGYQAIGYSPQESASLIS